MESFVFWVSFFLVCTALPYVLSTITGNRLTIFDLFLLIFFFIHFRSFPAAFHSILESCQEKIIDFLEAESIKFGSYLQVSPPKHQTTSFLGYMFAWQCILRMFRGAEADQRAAFANFFRKRGLIPPLLKILFSLLPYQSGHVINGRVVAIKGRFYFYHCGYIARAVEELTLKLLINEFRFVMSLQMDS